MYVWERERKTLKVCVGEREREERKKERVIRRRRVQSVPLGQSRLPSKSV